MIDTAVIYEKILEAMTTTINRTDIYLEVGGKRYRKLKVGEVLQEDDKFMKGDLSALSYNHVGEVMTEVMSDIVGQKLAVNNFYRKVSAPPSNHSPTPPLQPVVDNIPYY